MLYERTYVRACARSQGVRKVVKSEGAGTQTIRNLGIKVRAIKSIYCNKEVSYSHIIAQWIISRVQWWMQDFMTGGSIIVLCMKHT